MITSFSSAKFRKAIPVYLISQESDYLKQVDNYVKQAVKSQKFEAKAGQTCFVYDYQGKLERVLVGESSNFSMWDIAHLPQRLSKGTYKIVSEYASYAEPKQLELLSLGWGLGCYEYTAYKKTESAEPATLILDRNLNLKALQSQISALFMARDLINVPPNEMVPDTLDKFVRNFLMPYKISVKTIKNEALKKKNFPMIYAVGKASENKPCLIDFSWGNKKHKKVTLVGKGVTFDTGGLDLKPSANMALMKKDMAGAAAVLALAKMLIDAKAKINLRVLIPAAENSVGSAAFRPQDVLISRKGTSIEIGNTDAEGRLILADAFTYAMLDQPDLMIDFATLTGAGRVALGFDVPALFGNESAETRHLSDLSLELQDPLWHMPLWRDYFDQLKSPIADMNNSGPGYGGAITAALFLEHFVDPKTTWFHVDFMGWHQKTRPGRPEGGEVIGIRAMYEYILKSLR